MPRSTHAHLTLGLAFGMAALAAAASPAPEPIPLPALRIAGHPARAHTQGLELIGPHYYVTARREDTSPHQALLLRTAPSPATGWEAWDLTLALPPADPTGRRLDHPGGLQFDGTLLWIPIAESRRNGQSRIQAFRPAELRAGQRPVPVVDFTVGDHVGALAVATHREWVLGASWDTETVYVWTRTGTSVRTWSADDLVPRHLGPRPPESVAVQDWKIVDDRLYAGGLVKAGSRIPSSRLLVVDRVFDPDFHPVSATLDPVGGTELAREAMAIVDGWAYFLPNDLGTTNTAYRLRLADLQFAIKPRPATSP